jgi:hypothetical protein
LAGVEALSAEVAARHAARAEIMERNDERVMGYVVDNLYVQIYADSLTDEIFKGRFGRF